MKTAFVLLNNKGTLIHNLRHNKKSAQFGIGQGNSYLSCKLIGNSLIIAKLKDGRGSIRDLGGLGCPPPPPPLH